MLCQVILITKNSNDVLHIVYTGLQMGVSNSWHDGPILRPELTPIYPTTEPCSTVLLTYFDYSFRLRKSNNYNI